MSQAREESEFSVDSARQLNQILLENQDMPSHDWDVVTKYFATNVHPRLLKKAYGIRFTDDATDYLMNSEGHDLLISSMMESEDASDKLWMAWDMLYGIVGIAFAVRLLYSHYTGYALMNALTPNPENINTQSGLYICDSEI